MKNSFQLNKIKVDLSFCKDYWTVIYGSITNYGFIPNRSDIDVAVITKVKDKKANIETWKSLWGKYSKPYDLKVFELLPLFLKIEIINDYRVLFGDQLAISEYFYQFRKVWKDMIPRIKENQYSNIKEKIESLERQKTLI